MSNKQKHNQEKLKIKKTALKHQGNTFFIDLGKVGINTKVELEMLIRSEGIRPEDLIVGFENLPPNENLGEYLLIQSFKKGLGKKQFFLKKLKK